MNECDAGANSHYPLTEELLSVLPDGVLVLSRDARIRYANPAAMTLLGDAAPGRPVGPSLASWVASTPFKTWQRDGQDACGEWEAQVAPDPSSSWCRIRWRLQGPWGFVFVQDITPARRRQAELERYASDILGAKVAYERQAEELASINRMHDDSRRQAEEARLSAEQARLAAEQARRAAEAASSAKSAFLANMSHEIRTPMTAIVGFADMMLEPGLGDDQRRDCLSTIRRNARHLAELINDILDLSKIEAGRMDVERIEVDVPKLLAEVVSMMRPRALERGLDFQVHFDGPVRRKAQTDPLRVKQILVNLVGNAIKFTERGLVMLRVCDTPGRILRFEVVDTGIGIEPSKLTSLFEPFVQEDDSTTRRFGGTGLGLTISRRLARSLGGDIRVQSTPGEGSIFTVDLDVGDAAAERMVGIAESDVPELPRTRQLIEALPRCRILLVEDGKDNQRLIGTYLRRAGAELVVADNGRLGLDAVAAADAAGQCFDLVLMDMQMPELDGYGAASALRQRGFTRPIVALTAHAMSDDRAKCLSAGCSEYLTKPIDRGVLIDTVARLIGSGHPASAQVAPPSSTSATPPPPAEDEVVSEMESEPDAELRDLLREFVEGLPGSVGRLERHMELGDFAAATRVAHQLKGAGGGYGFPRISTLAAEAEAALKSASPAAREKVAVLAAYCRRVRGYRRSAERGDPAQVAA